MKKRINSTRVVTEAEGSLIHQATARNSLFTTHENRRFLQTLVADDVLTISMKNLQLAQLRSLLHEVSSNSFGINESTSQSSYHIMNDVVQIFLYYETAINLACSILDICSILEAKILSFIQGSEVKPVLLESWVRLLEFPKFDTHLRTYINKNITSFQSLLFERGEAHKEMSSIIRSIDLTNPRKSKLELLLLAKEKESRVKDVCQLVQPFLMLLDKQIPGLIRSGMIS